MSAIEIKLTPPDLLERMRQAPRLALSAMAKAMDLQNQFTIGHLSRTRMTGQGPFPVSAHQLGVRTNRLRSSIRASKSRVSGGVVESAIGSNVKYAGIHEFGGTIAPHLIKARFGKSLRFMIGGKVIFRRSVKHPGATYPARAPIYHSIKDREAEIGRALSEAVVKALEGQP